MSHYFTLFFFNRTATTEIYTLSLHDALPIFERGVVGDEVLHLALDHEVAALLDVDAVIAGELRAREAQGFRGSRERARSEEHTSELQSQSNLVCRLLLEKKKKKKIKTTDTKK